MAAAGDVFASVVDQAMQGKINYPSDTIKIALMAAGYTPNLNTQVHWSDISANEASGTGYTAGGATVTSPTHVITAANSWGTTWAASTVEAAGAVIRPATGNGFLYQTPNGGTTGSSTPSFPTVVGETVTDNGVIWTCMGTSITVFSGAAVTWNATGGALTASYAVLVDTQTGVATTEPLIGVTTFAGSTTATNANFVVSPDPALGYCYAFTS